MFINFSLFASNMADYNATLQFNLKRNIRTFEDIYSFMKELSDFAKCDISELELESINSNHDLPFIGLEDVFLAIDKYAHPTRVHDAKEYMESFMVENDFRLPLDNAYHMISEYFKPEENDELD
jgi:hypothetical protein|tara:strand:- start:72 stop:443 length:372 start_codon:yes stop_codon:yes gene_type:complete